MMWKLDSIIVVKPGERIPLDGIVVEGESLIDTAALTGESVPRSAKAGDEIISGCVNGSGTLKVKTTKEFDDSTVAKILELVENASSKKAKVENFITRFAKYYTPVVTIGAVILALIPPPLILGGGLGRMDPESMYFPCYFLPMCTGHLRSFGILRRNRCSVQGRCPCKRKQLSGGSGRDDHDCF